MCVPNSEHLSEQLGSIVFTDYSDVVFSLCAGVHYRQQISAYIVFTDYSNVCAGVHYRQQISAYNYSVD